jgi:hypothetical protein
MTRDTADTLRANLFLGPARKTVEWAERELTDARAAMRKAADRVGLSRDGIFAESKYVPRATADTWYHDGHREGRRQGIEEIAAALQPPGPGDAFHETWKMLQKFGPPRLDLIDLDRAASRQDAVVSIQDEIRRRDTARYGEVTNPQALARQILAASERAKSATDSDPAPKRGPLAQAILDASKKAHRREDD